MYKLLLTISAVLLIFLSACSTPTSTATEATQDATASSSPTNIGEATSTVENIIILEATEYILDLELDYEAKTARVDETIRYQNQADEELAEIVLAVEPNLWTDCFSLESITVDGEDYSSYELDGQKLVIRKNLVPNQIVTIKIAFDLAIPRIEVNDQAIIIRSQVFGFTTRQTNLVDWFPFVVPYIAGEGWLLNEPATYGEHLAYESANFEVSVRFLGETLPVVAASGEMIDNRDGLNYSLINGRNFALSFSPDYLVESKVVDGVTVHSYYFPGNQLAGKAALDATVRALEVFNLAYGPYQHKSLSIVQEETAFSMEYDGLYFLERPLYYGYSGADSDFLPTIAAHETSHQWWFGLVGTDQANQPWLDEALATYSERLFNESISMERGNWWFFARLSLAENKDCPIDISIYGFYDFGCYYTESVYMRGGLFMHSLRNLIGDDAFFSFLKDFAGIYSHEIATASDFFTVLREHTDADLSGILQEYFDGTY